jgi:ATP adenylyltransferase/5',5'''-P-1,P-4-tetraphosphate phosphorylase II
MNHLEQINQLLHQQRQDWTLMRGNFEALKQVRVREFAFEGFTIKAQFNPARIQSTGAKVDAKTIAARKCFLCRENLPQEQRGVPFGGDYTILCNPFPIFRDHLTIPFNQHSPQEIETSFGRMLDLTREIGERYVVFYNGPKCGASAPDHLHFQAGEKGFLPIESEFESLRTRYGKPVIASPDLRLTVIDDGLRGIVSVEAKESGLMLAAFTRIYNALANHGQSNEEPMMNILATLEGDTFRVLILPRLKHRPSFYFAEAGEKLLLSPASVDLGGVCVLPIEADFLRLTKDHLVRMCDEVCMKGDALMNVARASRT